MSLPVALISSPSLPSVTSPRNLSSLPAEVLSAIAVHLDKPTAIGLSCVSRETQSVNIDSHLWQTVRLTVQGHEAAESFSSSSRAVRIAKQSEVTITDLLNKQIQAVLRRADARRWDMVQNLALVTRPEIIGAIVDILRNVGPDLQLLDIQAPNYRYFNSSHSSYDTLDVRILRSNITFPSLHTLIIGRYAAQFPRFIPYLCSLAPNLHTLIVDVCDIQDLEVKYAYGAVNSSGPAFPKPSPHLGVKSLCISRLCYFNDNEESIQLLTSHLQYLPNLQQISIDYPLWLLIPPPSDDGETSSLNYMAYDGEVVQEGSADWHLLLAERTEAMQIVVRGLAGLRWLVDVDWRVVYPGDFLLSFGDDQFMQMRRIVLRTVDWQTFFKDLIPLLSSPCLEDMYFTDVFPSSDPDETHLELFTTEPQRLPADLKIALASHSKLRRLCVLPPISLEPGLDIFNQLDEMEDIQPLNIHSYSMDEVEGDEHVHHIRLLMQDDPEVYQDFTDFRGKIVPLEILEQMRAADGLGEEVLERKWIMVEEKGWEVLIEWYTGKFGSDSACEECGLAEVCACASFEAGGESESDSDYFEIQPSTRFTSSQQVSTSIASSRTSGPNLLSLPTEVLDIIVVHIKDIPSLLAFTRVCKRLATLNIDQYLWRSVNLTVTGEDIEYDPWAKTGEIKAAKAVEAGFGPRLDAQVKAVLGQLDHKMAAMVKSLQITPRPIAIDGILKILESVSPSLLSLGIDGPYPHPGDKEWRPDIGHCLDTKLLDSGITFSHLNILSIGKFGANVPVFVLYLCSLAPQLNTLLVDVGERQITLDDTTDPVPFYPTLTPQTSLRELHLTGDTSKIGDEEIISALFAVYLQHFPHILKLSIDFPLSLMEHDLDSELDSEELAEMDEDYDGGGGEFEHGEQERGQAMEDIIREVMALEYLEDLVWRDLAAADFTSHLDGRQQSPKLRRLVLGTCRWDQLCISARKLPSLEVLLFTGMESDRPRPPISREVRHLTFRLADAIRESPLRLVQRLDLDDGDVGLPLFDMLDQWEKNCANGICSIHHGSQSLLLALLPVFGHVDLQWHTDFEEFTIPLKVIEEMRMVEGLSEVEWRTRGVEVGNAAWAVLTAWHTSVKKS